MVERDGSAKGIFFSQFAPFLDLINYSLHKVFLMDPWWNPAVERQAQDRIQRIGQYKPIRIVRFVIENTIEERILKLQEKKKLIFEGTAGGSSEALEKLTEADMRFLFVT